MALTAFRKSMANNWFVKGFLLLLVASFALWGIGDYVSGGMRGAALTVGEIRYSIEEVQTAYQNQVQRFQDMTGQTLTPEQAIQLGLPTLVLGQLLQEGALQTVANDLGLVAAPQAVRQALQQQPAFQVDGQFDMATYRQILRTVGVTPEAFEADQAKQTQIETLAGLFTPPALPLEVADKRIELALKAVTLEVVEIPATAVNVAAPLPEALEAYYNANQPKYVQPERRTVEVLTFDLPTFTAQIEVTEADLAAAYTARADSFATPEQRRVRQVLFPNQSAAEDAHAALMADTQALADLNVVEMGLISRNDVPPAFAAVVFDLAVADMSVPFEGALGWHIAVVDEVVPAVVPPLADVRADLTAALQQEQALDALLNGIEDVEDLLAGGAMLDEIAETLNLVATVREGVTANPADPILREAFSLPSNQPGNVLDLGNDTYAVVVVNQIDAARVPPLTEIEAQVRADVTLANQTAALEAELGAVVNSANTRGLAQAGQSVGIQRLDITTVTGLQAGNIQGQTWLDDAQIQTLLHKDPGFILARLSRQANTAYIARVVAVDAPELTDDQLIQARQSLRNVVQDTLAAQFLTETLQSIKIDYNVPLLQLVFSEGFDERMIPQP